MLNIQSLIKFPIPLYDSTNDCLTALVKKQLVEYTDKTQQEINHYIYKMYRFNSIEINEIESC